MTSRLEATVRYAHLGMLFGAALLVPTSRRSEWSEEWRNELWYVLRECSSRTSIHPRSIKEATVFCMGAYRDAIWLRRRSWQQQSPLAPILGSPWLCISLLIVALFAAWGIAKISPRVSAVHEMSMIRVSPLQIQELRALSGSVFTAQAENQVETSFGIAEGYFDGFSHYSIRRDTVWSNSMAKNEWTVAYAPSNFFAVTGLSVRPMGNSRVEQERLPQLVLSEETWIQDFGSRKNIIGTKFHVGSVDTIITGIASAGSKNLPGDANAWLLDSNSHAGIGNAEFVVGHLTKAGYFHVGPRWVLSLFGIILAVSLLPFLLRSPIGEYSNGTNKPSLFKRCQFWAFLITKLSFLLGIVYFTSVVLGCSIVQPPSQLSGLLQGVSAFILCLMSLNWAFHDQQRRCPICLRRLSHAVEVGQPSRTFLAWNGTELLCERGHVLLYIPDVPTSWFGGQRWVCLDGSWKFLFGRPGETPSL